MSSLKVRTLLLCVALGLAAGGFALLALGSLGGQSSLLLPPTFALVSLGLSLTLVWFGWQVLRFQDRERRASARLMNPLLATRVAVFAQATALAGAVLVGWHLALGIEQLGLLSARGLTASFWTLLSGLAGSLLLLGSGLWVESMCKIPPSDSSSPDGAPGSGGQASGYAARQEGPRG